MTAIFVVATARETVADYLAALILVYTILIFVYILVAAVLRLRRASARTTAR